MSFVRYSISYLDTNGHHDLLLHDLETLSLHYYDLRACSDVSYISMYRMTYLEPEDLVPSIDIFGEDFDDEEC